MKPVYGFNFGKAVKKAETLINECVKEKEGMAFTKIYANINGQLFEINEPISLYIYIKFFIRMAPRSMKMRYTK